MTDHNLPTQLDELRRLLIAAGGNPNSRQFQAQMEEARRRAYATHEARRQADLAARPKLSRQIGEAVIRMVEIISVFLTIVLVLGGLSVALVLLVIAEIAAVEKGFRAIDPTLSWLYATASVFFFLSVLFIREIIARGAMREDERVFSLRYAFNWLVYFIGFNRGWKPRYRQHASLLSAVDNAVRWLTWTIVIFGLLGRLFDTVSGLDGTWVDGLRHIAEQSTFTEMAGYIGSVVMTIGMLLGTHFAVYFIHQQYVKVTGGLEVGANFSDAYTVDLLIEREQAQVMQGEILKLAARARSGTD